ncbi:nucleoside 2-deoxyribosyltransferase [Anaerobium acetethylicum]|uniref:Nucleoside 2-deoxyribosyltransferase n=1 Tax=Anaerobium acetethylicum TaxID=1619234 RepID=A0A1D3TTE1_9FIRM|nr:nucleoside 2-deoxyribosyltransferase [Anaerobium acetethylicum]SCP97256.1 Nucleoside 2-deoxyribosyltransferase [Anaerobium acetethylicum]
MFRNESIYIAGPECFYTGGNEILNAMRRRSESFGFSVTLPNDDSLDLSHEDLRKNADEIFENCAKSMNESTAIIVDLEAFRGSEPDNGSIYEIGMAYARGIRCYGYTRDKRNVLWKNQGAKLVDGIVYDESGRIHPYADLPFAPSVIGSTKVVEGDFDDCLKMMMIDIEEEYKESAKRSEYIDHSNKTTKAESDRLLVYLSGPARYDMDGERKYGIMKEICRKYGFDAVSPLDMADGVEKIATDNPYIRAANEFDNYQQHVRNCDIIIADLNDFRGWESCNDTGFECGMAFQLGKKMYGYMDDTTIMKKRIPNYGEEAGNRDMCGSNVENFDYPVNLMFASSMKIFEGSFENVISRIAEDIKK